MSLRQQLPHSIKRCVVLISKSVSGYPREKSCLRPKRQLFWESFPTAHRAREGGLLLCSPWVFCTASSHCDDFTGLHLTPDVYFLRAETGLSSSVWHIILHLQPSTFRKPSKWCLTELMNYVKRSHFQKITNQ